MARTPQEQYDAIDALIAQLEARLDQAYSVRGKQMTLKQLAPLYPQRERLAVIAQAANGGTMATLLQVDRAR